MDTVGAKGSVGQDQTPTLTVPPGFVPHSKIKCRPWILDDHFDQNINNDHNEEQQEEELDVQQSHEEEDDLGVEQSHEVSAQRDPSGARSTRFEEAPVFQPTHEEFKDTLKFLESISRQVKPYGFCRIIPPPSWQSPCLGENDAWKTFEFTTQVQSISESKGKGLVYGSAKKSKRQRISGRNFDDESGDKHPTNHGVDGFLGTGQLQFKLGPHHTLESLKKIADCFKESYFSPKSKLINPEGDSVKSHEHWKPSEDDIEREYWRISEKPAAEIEVLCGANIDARELRSKYPEFFRTEETSTSGGYQDSGWNLNNISNLPESPFVFGESNYLGNPAPQFHVGMCFSSRPWGIERHWFHTLHYLHSGAPKIWYGAQGHHFQKCKAAVEELFSSKVNQCPESSNEQVMQISPAAVLAEGIPVRRCLQQPKEFVLFLPGAYHSGFDCGFNVSESASFALLDWFSHGLTAATVYHAKRLKMPISHDRLLLRAAHEAVKANWEVLLCKDKFPSNLRWKERCGKGSVLAKALRDRVRSEARQRQYLTSNSQCREMDESFDEGAAKECAICHFHLYISASFCRCDPSRYACLWHARHLCSCAWSDKVFLFRYNNYQLNLLADAAEGSFAACHRWVRDNHSNALDLSQAREGGRKRDSSSADNVSEHKGERKKDSSSADNAVSEHKGGRKYASDHISSVKEMSKKLVSESMARILQASGTIAMNLDPSSSSSTSDDDSSDDEFLSSFFGRKESETHNASSERALTDQTPGRSKTEDVVYISSDDEA